MNHIGKNSSKYNLYLDEVFFRVYCVSTYEFFKDKWTMPFKEHTGPWSVSCAQNITKLDKQNGVYKSEKNHHTSLTSLLCQFQHTIKVGPDCLLLKQCAVCTHAFSQWPLNIVLKLCGPDRCDSQMLNPHQQMLFALSQNSADRCNNLYNRYTRKNILPQTDV